MSSWDSSVSAAESDRNFDGTLKNRSLDFAVARSPFKTQPSLMRINGDEFSFLHHVVDRQLVFLTAHDDKFRAGSLRPAVLQFDCDLARIAEELIAAFPFALDLLRDGGVAGRRFDLRWSNFLQGKWRGISRLFEIPGQFPITHEVCVKLRRPGALIGQRALNRENDVIGFHRNISEWRAFDPQSRNGNGTLPAPAAVTPRRQIDDEHQL